VKQAPSHARNIPIYMAIRKASSSLVYHRDK
jgi:hypothetical protein